MATVFKDQRKRKWLSPEGADRPLRSPVAPAVVEQARHYRKQRLAAELRRADCAAILHNYPINIRYALDVTNIQLWTLHNPFPFALVCANGYTVDFQFHGSEHLARGLTTIDEVRNGTSCFYAIAGEHGEARVRSWAAEIGALLRQRGVSIRSLAIDKPEPWAPGRSKPITLVERQVLTEMARSIKSGDEIEPIRWTIRFAEAGMARMQ